MSAVHHCGMTHCKEEGGDILLPSHHFIIQSIKKINYPTCTLGKLWLDVIALKKFSQELLIDKLVFS